jgi:hypothetical protein
MSPFAIGASQKSPEEYLNPSILDASYQSAYRLLFSRQMVNILSTQTNSSSLSTGQRRFTTQAIVLVPAFTYLAEGFLGVTVILACWLLSYSRRVSKLRSDPSTISALMSLSADDEALLRSFKSMDQESNAYLEKAFASQRFRISQGGPDQNTHLLLDEPNAISTPQIDIFGDEKLSRKESFDNIVRGVQPLEFKLKTGLVFFSLQIALFVVISIFFILVLRKNGKN